MHEVEESLLGLLNSSEYALLYEEVLRTALENKSDWKDLIANTKGLHFKRYLNDLDMCLQSLVNNK